MAEHVVRTAHPLCTLLTFVRVYPHTFHVSSPPMCCTQDVSKEEYQKFYKAVSKDYQDAMGLVHFKAEGDVEFKAVIFVPKTVPYDFYDKVRVCVCVCLLCVDVCVCVCCLHTMYRVTIPVFARVSTVSTSHATATVRFADRSWHRRRALLSRLACCAISVPVPV